MKNRETKEYLLAEKVVFLEEALNRANKILNDDGKLGVLPRFSVSFKESSSHHKKIRNLIDEA